MDLKQIVRDVPDFPAKGILFRDITPVLASPEALKEAVEKIIVELDGIEFDMVAGPESRGFIFAVPVSYMLGKGFIPIRKVGKLPYDCIQKEYELEYGTAKIEMHTDAISQGQRVVIVDDLLATGGTAKALVDLIEEAGGVVSALVFLIELAELGGRKALDGYEIRTILKY